MKDKINYYIRQLKEVYEGENWNDGNYLSKLENIKEETAFKQPKAGIHSIAEIIWHLIFWRRAVLYRITGDYEFDKKAEKEQNFLTLEALKQKGWSNLLDELKQSQNGLINFLSTKTDDVLDIEYKPGRKLEVEIEGIVHHDIYHLGQIGLVIAMLRE